MKAIQKCVLVGSLIAAGPPQNLASAAANWPEQTVRILVPSAAGSSVDVAARLFAEQLALRWGKPAVVDNRAGADGILAVQALLQADDGHTLLFSFPGVVTVVPLLHEKIPYDPVTDLVPITSVAHDFLTVAVTPTLPVSSLNDLVKLTQVRPGEFNWAAPPGAPYLTFLEFQRRSGVKLVYVPYRSSVLALPDVIAGQIHVVVTPLASALPLAREGKLKLLAVTTHERPPASREIPTAIEAGFPELTVEAPLGLFGPKRTPPDVRERISADVLAIAAEPKIRQRLEAIGMLAKASTPAEYAAALNDQATRWAALAKTYGARPRQ
jgi:tripartite-type tricarboxylate transporter receptor subunit TctC